MTRSPAGKVIGTGARGKRGGGVPAWPALAEPLRPAAGCPSSVAPRPPPHPAAAPRGDRLGDRRPAWGPAAAPVAAVVAHCPCPSGSDSRGPVGPAENRAWLWLRDPGSERGGLGPGAAGAGERRTWAAGWSAGAAAALAPSSVFDSSALLYFVEVRNVQTCKHFLSLFEPN